MHLHQIEIEFATPLYDQEVKLRTEVLRKPLGLEFTEEQLSQEFSDTHLGLLCEEQLVACLILTKKNEDTVKMRQVAVDPAYQSKGIGSALVSYCEKTASKLGYKKIELNARDTAVDFYLKNEYKIEGEPFYEVGIPHRYMWKAF